MATPLRSEGQHSSGVTPGCGMRCRGSGGLSTGTRLSAASWMQKILNWDLVDQALAIAERLDAQADGYPPIYLPPCPAWPQSAREACAFMQVAAIETEEELRRKAFGWRLIAQYRNRTPLRSRCGSRPLRVHRPSARAWWPAAAAPAWPTTGVHGQSVGAPLVTSPVRRPGWFPVTAVGRTGARRSRSRLARVPTAPRSNRSTAGCAAPPRCWPESWPARPVESRPPSSAPPANPYIDPIGPVAPAIGPFTPSVAPRTGRPATGARNPTRKALRRGEIRSTAC